MLIRCSDSTITLLSHFSHGLPLKGFSRLSHTSTSHLHLHLHLTPPLTPPPAPQLPQVLANISHLASVAKKKGDIETALGLHQQVLAGFAAIGHPMTHRSAGHVILLLQETGRSDEAEAIAQEYGVSLAASPKAGDQVPEVSLAQEVQ